MIETEVCIIGGGPTGLTASLLLSKLGIHHILVEKRSHAQLAPAAHVINRRTMEIFRQLGLPMEDIYNLDKHGAADLNIRWGLGLTDQALGQLTVNTGRKGPAYSQEYLANISQPLLEEILSKHAKQKEYCTLKSAHTWLGFLNSPPLDQKGEHQISEIQNEDGRKIQIKSSFVLAADGANSSIRNALKIKNLGPDDVATFLSLSCEVDQSKIDRPGNTLIDWCLDPELAGILICHDPKKLSVYMRILHEPYESIDDYDDETCKDLLAKLFGKNIPFKILHKGTWQMTAQIAENFQVGNIFLVGDSAHRFPPTGGLGLNSGVADVHNLVWKIAATRSQNTSIDLLKSYEKERKAVVQDNRDKSLTNFKKMDEVVETIGLDPTKAAIPTRILSSFLLRHLSKGLKASIFKLIITPATKALAKVSASSEEGQRLRLGIQEAINNQREHFDMPGLELGYIYGDTSGNAVLDYIPCILPGARFPHIALEVENGLSSTLDYIAYKKYTLFANKPLNVQANFETFGFKLETVDISTLSPKDRSSTLAEQLNIPIEGWVLVRPDGHITNTSLNS